MVVALVIAVTLLVAVTLSQWTHRSPLSMTLLFLVVGVVAGQLRIAVVDPLSTVVTQLVNVTLFAVLFTDGMLVGARQLRAAWQEPGRALLVGMPLTFVLITLFAKLVLPVSWVQALLLGAVLAPTDPVLARAIVGREAVPRRVRRLLNVESGLNDGLAVLMVVPLLPYAGGDPVSLVGLVGQVAGGAAVGLLTVWAGARVARLPLLGSRREFESLRAFAIAFVAYTLAGVLHVSQLLAGYVGGIALASVAPELRDDFDRLGNQVTEVLKLASVLVFGSLVSPHAVRSLPTGTWALAVLSLLVARPVAIGLSFLGSGLKPRERLTVAWFGPKGFASVVYAMLVLQSGVPDAAVLFGVSTVTIAASMALHSTTDHLIARSFTDEPPTGEPPTDEPPMDAGTSGQSGPQAGTASIRASIQRVFQRIKTG